MLKIAFEARALQKEGGGVRTYVEQLLTGLRQNGSVDASTPDAPLAHEALLPLWLNWQLPEAITKLTPDVVHYTKAAIPAKKVAPTVVTIYDVIPILFPESQKFFPRLLWPKLLRQAAQESDHVITISEASKRDIVKHLQVTPEKVTVTPLAVDPTFKNHPVSAKAEPPLLRKEGKPYILYLGTIEPRKNVPALVRAFAKIATDIPHKLVIAGRPYKGIDEVLYEVVKHDLEERVEIRDFVPSEELPNLYANADLFVWPSIYEGWGFPPQEAMASGVPVIVSDGGSLPEVVGQAGITVSFSTVKISDRLNDTDFEARLAQAMKEVLQDEAKQNQLRQSGLDRATQRTWQTVADETIKVYRTLV